ncbi:hypothetical protein HBH98_015170 [Parastagonospora nodorum]|nr:hypothetical protein HBH50_112820 [Parastagonospora nodorum]KAH4088484.1 hypothetical protein HBH48_129790 [Parastagonospora nodorum]KAH4103469.1 hypothetical protein HBH46_108900 [Parastagonospora nodorum]KAH4185837.1 hypothetical protein HBI95_242210 [Parastagonospora nodorum]KAH4354135.1 hypothetical protein HBH98_015170 [Parastagonospora nodorum]
MSVMMGRPNGQCLFWIMVCLTLCFWFFNDACIYEVMTLDGIRWGFSAKLVGRIS